MGSFSKAKLELVQSTEGVIDPAPAQELENPFAPGPKRRIDPESLADHEIQRLEELGRQAGYRGEQSSKPAETQPEMPEWRQQQEFAAPTNETSQAPRPRPRSRLRRRSINVPQESITLRIPSSVLDQFDEWCDGQGLSKKAGFVELVAGVNHRARHLSVDDEARDAALLSGAGEGEMLRGQMPRHLARRMQTEAEEPVTFFVPCSSMQAFEAWCGDRGLTKKAGFVEMVRRVLRSRLERSDQR